MTSLGVCVAAFFLPMLLGASGVLAEGVPDLRWIMLSDQVLPSGGSAEATGDGWVVHGIFNGAVYRFGSDSRFLLVGTQTGQEWQALGIDNSWTIGCHVLLPVDQRRCTIIRVVPVDPSRQKLAGIEFKEDRVCFQSEIVTRKAEIRIDDRPPLSLSESEYCMRGEKAEQFKKDVLAGRSISIKGYFAATEPVVDFTLSNHGLKQALQLRAWIYEQYKAKRLQAPAVQ